MLNVKITGVDENQKRIDSLIDHDEILDILIKGGFSIEHDAKRLCPVDTGRLRSSISVNWDDNSETYGQVEAPAKTGDGVLRPRKNPGDIAVVRIGTNVEYAPYVEYGTRRQRPQPYLTPAAMAKFPLIRAELERYLDDKTKE